MYKIAYVSGDYNGISSILKKTIEDINVSGGQIEHIVQSQSSANYLTIVTVTIIYKIPRSSVVF